MKINLILRQKPMLNLSCLTSTIKLLRHFLPITFILFSYNSFAQHRDDRYRRESRDNHSDRRDDRDNRNNRDEHRIKITGVVLDEDNLPMYGVNIKYGTDSATTVTNDEGKFYIGLNKVPALLTFTYAGYIKQEVSVQKEEEMLSVHLKQDNALNEVVVIGYGTTTRLKNTGSVTKVRSEEIARQPISNPLLALQGRIPGMIVSANSGNLGSAVTIQIRGKNSIAAGNNPLYIVDGVPFSNSSVANTAVAGVSSTVGRGVTQGGQSPFSTINPADIESIEVLKDADATAIYGSRGANGVVIITTKRPKGGRTNISADVYRGYQNVVNKLDLLKPADYYKLRRDAFALDGVQPTIATAPDLLLWDQNINTDWQEVLMGKTAPVTNAQLDIQGGSQQTQFIISLGYRNEEGVGIGKNNLQRGSARFNVQHKSVNEKFTASANVYYAYTKLDTRGSSSINGANSTIPPNLPKYDSLGKPYFLGSSTSTTTTSPYRSLYEQALSDNYTIVGGVTFGYKIIKDLNIKVDANFTRMDVRGRAFQFNNYFNPLANNPYKNQTTLANNYMNSYNLEPQLNYDKKFGASSIHALVGTTFNQSLREGDVVVGRDFPTELLMNNIQSAGVIVRSTNLTATSNTVASTYSKYNFTSVFGRLGYDYNNKYIANITFRRDGSTRFGEDYRFGNFAALGLAYVFSKENFIKDNLEWLSLGKIRSSLGLVGNDQIADYAFLSTFSTTTNYHGQTAISADQIGNPNLRWEKTRKFEVATELGFINNRFLLNVGYFNNLSGNQLINIPLASQTGWTSYLGNLDAKVRNKGIEIEITSKNITTNDFQWTTNFNVTSFKNILVEFPNLATSSYAYTYIVGKSINLLRKYNVIRINPETGLAEYIDHDGDKLITSNGDKVYAGKTDPDFYGGLGNNFRYKGLELEVFFQFVKQPTINNFLSNSNYYPVGNMYNTTYDRYEGSWKEKGQIAKYPRITAQTSGNVFNDYYLTYYESDASVGSGSFVRLKNVALSYNLPRQLLNKVKLSNVRLYMQAQNLLTFTKYEGFDPETGSELPVLRTITFGLNVSL